MATGNAAAEFGTDGSHPCQACLITAQAIAVDAGFELLLSSLIRRQSSLSVPTDVLCTTHDTTAVCSTHTSLSACTSRSPRHASRKLISGGLF